MMLGEELFIRRELRQDLALDLDGPEASLRDADLRALVEERFAAPATAAAQPPAAVVAYIIVVGVIGTKLGLEKWSKDSQDNKNEKDTKDTTDRALKNNKDTADAAIKMSKDTQDKQSQDQKDSRDTVEQEEGDGGSTGSQSFDPFARRSFFDAPTRNRRSGSFTTLLERLAV